MGKSNRSKQQQHDPTPTSSEVITRHLQERHCDQKHPKTVLIYMSCVSVYVCFSQQHRFDRGGFVARCQRSTLPPRSHRCAPERSPRRHECPAPTCLRLRSEETERIIPRIKGGGQIWEKYLRFPSYGDVIIRSLFSGFFSDIFSGFFTGVFSGFFTGLARISFQD